VSWAPALPPGSLVSSQPPSGVVKRLVTSGCDNTAKVWRWGEAGWAQEATLSGHTDWVRDAAWAPNLGLPLNTIATAGQDGQVGPMRAPLLRLCWVPGCTAAAPAAAGGAWAGPVRQRQRRAPLAHRPPKNRCAAPHTTPRRAQVFAWNERTDGSGWEKALVHDFKAPVWKVSWSVTGGILAVADGNNAVSLWKESLDGTWQQVEQ
jgi:protein transport protein SEC13